jgi:hypothetical protein
LQVGDLTGFDEHVQRSGGGRSAVGRLRHGSTVRCECRDVLPWLKPGASQSTAALLHRCYGLKAQSEP